MNTRKIALIVMTSIVLTACGGGGSDNGTTTPPVTTIPPVTTPPVTTPPETTPPVTTPPETTPPVTTPPETTPPVTTPPVTTPPVTTPPPAQVFALSGQIQKGPLSIGSSVSVNELDALMNPTGKTYNVPTSDYLGSFSVPAGVNTSFVEIIGDGFYMDELTGNLGPQRIQLRSIVNLSVETKPTINILTALQTPRLKKLLATGSNYATASAQSQREVLLALGVDPAKVASLSSFYAMKIDGSTDADSVLLAMSAVFSQMATNAAVAKSTFQAVELSTYIASVGAEIANNGTITTPLFFSQKAAASAVLNLPAVRRNIESYYAQRGVPLVAPRFEEWVDKSGYGVLPQRLLPVASLVLNQVTGALPGQLITSNLITVAGLGAGVAVSVTGDGAATIIKNNAVITGSFADVVNGDILALRVKAPGYGQSIKTLVTIGSSPSNWTVSSKQVSGSISGLVGSGLVLQNLSTEKITIPANSTSFAFLGNTSSATTYNVNIVAMPTAPEQICVVSNGASTTPSASDAIGINCYIPGAFALTKTSGDLQTVAQHQYLAQPLVVTVVDRAGKPVQGEPVTFRPVAGTGYTATAVVTSDASGKATWIGAYIHSAGQKIEALVGGAPAATFTLNVVPTTHPYDGIYNCSLTGHTFAMTIANGVIDSSATRFIMPSLPYYHTNGSLNEASGVWSALSTVSSDGKINLSGQLTIDTEQRGTGTAAAFNETTPTDSYKGTMTCQRL